MHRAPRRTGRRSSSSSPAARRSRGQAEWALPRPQERAGQCRLRPRRGRRRERRRASEPRRKEREGSLGWVMEWFLGRASPACRTAYRLGRVGALTAVNNFPLLFFVSSILQLVDRRFSPLGPGIGSGGVERFRLRCLAVGETRLRLTYKRRWEKTAAEDIVFRVHVRN
jgi:hypothetical protein